jgi:hypothetical protein
MKRSVLSLFALTVLIGSALPAQAIPPILRPGTRPMWASGAFGPAINLSDAWGQFKLTQTFGYHFSGTAAGPAIAIDLQESFGQHLTTFELVPNFVWDIAIVDGLGLYLSPSAGLGFVHVGADGYSGSNGLTLQFGFAAKLILGDRGMVFFRPINIDILMGDSGGNVGWQTRARWDMLWGGGVIF